MGVAQIKFRHFNQCKISHAKRETGIISIESAQASFGTRSSGHRGFVSSAYDLGGYAAFKIDPSRARNIDISLTLRGGCTGPSLAGSGRYNHCFISHILTEKNLIENIFGLVLNTNI